MASCVQKLVKEIQQSFFDQKPKVEIADLNSFCKETVDQKQSISGPLHSELMKSPYRIAFGQQYPNTFTAQICH